jgi:hypothetical protein
MLCVVSENHVAVRGAHAIVVCDSQAVCSAGGAHHDDDDDDDDDGTKQHYNIHDNDDTTGLCWRGRQRIQAGSKLEFREAEGDGLIEFQVVLVNIKTRKIIENEKMLVGTKEEAQPSNTTNSMPKFLASKNHPSSSQGGELQECPRGLLLEEQYSGASRKKDLSNLLPHPSNKKISMNTSQEQQAQFRICFVPLGQDLSRQRITLLSELAEKRGAQVMMTHDFRLATQLIVSEQVATLQQVATKLGITTQEELKCHLDQVSVCHVV